MSVNVLTVKPLGSHWTVELSNTAQLEGLESLQFFNSDSVALLFARLVANANRPAKVRVFARNPDLQVEYNFDEN